jgi:hypothetical protein
LDLQGIQDQAQDGPTMATTDETMQPKRPRPAAASRDAALRPATPTRPAWPRTPLPLLKWLGTWLLVATLLGGCAPKRVFRQPDLVEERPPPSAPRPAGTPTAALQKGLEVANLAQAQLGRPYRWGGNLPQRGFDCSGLVQWTYQSVGVDLPRVVREQVRVGRSVDPQRLHPGDLVFFNLTGDRASHVGIYVGEGRFVHAPRTGQPVRTDELSDPYWRQRWSATRRILDP